ncbi:MAG: Maf family protein [Alkalispirochaeta sp.]
MLTPAHRVTLASASPRRKELLAQIGIDAIVAPSHAHEESVSIAALRQEGASVHGAPAQLALQRARLKAHSAQLRPGTIGLLAADTVVAVEGRSLEKPRDADDARSMLAVLSGRDHHVHTAVVFVSNQGDVVEETSTTTVSFLPLSDAEIDDYVSTGEWQGVAGAYRIQGRGGAYITAIHGSYTAVVGLPIGTVYSIIRRFLGAVPRP